MEKIIADTKRMAGRLRDRQQMAKEMIIESTAMAEEIDALRQLQDDFEGMNRLGRNTNNTNYQLIMDINNEHPYIREIQLENRELRSCLADHQRALEHVMSKYREHTQKKILNSKITLNLGVDENYNNKCADKIIEMVAVMRHAADLPDDNCHRDHIMHINRLITENKGLREILQISQTYGSIAQNVHGKNVAVQTDDSPASALNPDTLADTSSMSVASIQK